MTPIQGPGLQPASQADVSSVAAVASWSGLCGPIAAAPTGRPSAAILSLSSWLPRCGRWVCLDHWGGVALMGAIRPVESLLAATGRVPDLLKRCGPAQTGCESRDDRCC